MRRLLLVSAVLLAAAMPALAQTPLDGWDKLKFGMTPDQVRGQPGITWDDLVKLPVPGGLSIMDSKAPVPGMAGEKFTARLTFDGASKLQQVDLVTIRGLEEKPCMAFTHKLVAGAEQVYGPFAPDRKLVQSDTPDIVFENAGAKSKLMVQAGDSPDTGKTVIATTRHAVGKALVQVSLNYNAPVKTDDKQQQAYLCETHVIFSR
jgi:hypothetical protein